jgi:hypothetical protein
LIVGRGERALTSVVAAVGVDTATDVEPEADVDAEAGRAAFGNGRRA